MHQTVSGSESESQQEADHRIDQEHMYDINRVHHQYLGTHAWVITYLEYVVFTQFRV